MIKRFSRKICAIKNIKKKKKFFKYQYIFTHIWWSYVSDLEALSKAFNIYHNRHHYHCHTICHNYWTWFMLISENINKKPHVLITFFVNNRKGVSYYGKKYQKVHIKYTNFFQKRCNVFPCFAPFCFYFLFVCFFVFHSWTMRVLIRIFTDIVKLYIMYHLCLILKEKISKLGLYFIK